MDRRDFLRTALFGSGALAFSSWLAYEFSPFARSDDEPPEGGEAAPDGTAPDGTGTDGTGTDGTGTDGTGTDGAGASRAELVADAWRRCRER